MVELTSSIHVAGLYPSFILETPLMDCKQDITSKIDSLISSSSQKDQVKIYPDFKIFNKKVRISSERSSVYGLPSSFHQEQLQ